MMVTRRNRVFAVWAFLLLFLFCNFSVRANVYATDIRINGSQVGGVLIPGGQITISYILNDNANAGVWFQINSGTNIVWTNSLTGGSSGTFVGLNSVVWDGTNNCGTNVLPGAYTVSITAASDGYDSWTNMTDDGTNFQALGPRGIDVNRNTNSPYYGRVFISCIDPLYTILKANADGSPGDEGASNPGGAYPTNLTWGSGLGNNMYYSPWKIAVAPNDKVYIDDFSAYGFVYAFDETITNYLGALRPDNYPYPAGLNGGPDLSGLWITGTGTNEYIWMSDENPYGSAGIIEWPLMADGTVATNNTGTVIVPVTNNTALTIAPYDVSVDTNGNIYTIQFLTNADLSDPVVMCFSNYTGVPITNDGWATGAGNQTLNQAYGVAVNPDASLLAVAVRGTNGQDAETGITGMLNLYYATNGQFFTNLDQTGGDQYTDVAWDNIGNLYALDATAEVWRVYSPPGSNQATTVAVPIIQAYNSLAPPLLINPNMSSCGIGFMLQGQSDVTYWIEQSPDLMNWTPVATNFSASANRPIMIPFADNQDFYRAVATP